MIGYCGTQNTIDSLGGTKKYQIGTSGTHSITTLYISEMITRAENLIDVKLSPAFGTSGFGTSVSGTRGVPAIIKDICADLSAWMVLDNITQPTTARAEVDFGQRLYKRAMNLLDSIVTGELMLPGFEKTEAQIPQFSDYSFDVTDEAVTLTGTDLAKLQWDKVIAYSDVVQENALDATGSYTRGVDYRVYYFNDPETSGTLAGYIRRLGGTNITDGQTVKVRYKVLKDNVFGVRDARAWGHVDSGLGKNNTQNGGF